MIFIFVKEGSKPVHIWNEERNSTYCWVERNSRAAAKLNATAEEIPTNRRVCGNCAASAGLSIPKVPVLAPVAIRPIERAEKPKKAYFIPNDEFYQSWEWAKARFEILKTYGPICMCCGATAKETKIVVDHIKPRRFYPELALDLDNLQVLCDYCNRGKNNNDETDFRDWHDELFSKGLKHLKDILAEDMPEPTMRGYEKDIKH